MINFIKKHNKIIKSIFAFALILCIGICSFSYTSNITANAEEPNLYTLSGNVYIKSGNSEFYKVSLVETNIHLILNDTNIGSGKINEKGEYYITLFRNVSPDSAVNFLISTLYNESYIYLFNSQSNNTYLDLSQNTTCDLYFQYYPFDYSISDSVYHNYTMNAIYIGGDSSGVTSARFCLPRNNTYYMRNWEFSTILQFTSLYNNESGFWLNLYDIRGNYKTGIGVYTNGTSIALKDNTSNIRKVIDVSSVGYSNIYIYCHYKFEIDNTNNHLFVTYYCDVADNSYFRGGSTYFILNRYDYGHVENVKLERYRGSFELTNFTFVDNSIISVQAYEDAYDNGFNYGYGTGYKNGRAQGYALGVEDANTFTFNKLISSVVDAPVTVFTKLFDVEILGVNLKTFVISLLSLFVVFAIVKFLIGKFGG